MDNEVNLLSLTEAARKLGLSRKRVFDFIKDGRLPAQKIGNTYAISESDLNLIKDRPTGRPKKEKSK